MDLQDTGVGPSRRPERQARRVGLLGLGTVGSAVAARLLDADWRANAVARGHVPPTLVAVAARDGVGERKLDLPADVRLTDDAMSVATAQDVDVVVELMGGTEAAGHAILAALAAGKSVVTANKELLAKQGSALEAAARETGRGSALRGRRGWRRATAGSARLGPGRQPRHGRARHRQRHHQPHPLDDGGRWP